MTVPRRLPADPDRRARTILTQTRGALSGEGSTATARPLHHRPQGVPAQSNFVVVIHGDDPDVDRPAADLVYWVGAATPNNGLQFDWWFEDTI